MKGSAAGMPWGTAGWASRWLHRRAHAQPYAPPHHGAHRAYAISYAGVSLGDPVTGGLARTGRRDGGWVRCKFQMAEDLADHLALRDDGDKPQCSTLTERTRDHLQAKDPMQQPCPTPARRRGAHLRLIEALLPEGWEDRSTEVAVRRQTAAIAHQVDMGQRDQRRQLLQEFQWREANPCGAVRPRMRERVDQIAVGIFLEALQGHGPSGGVANQLFQLIPPMRRNRRIGVQ